MDTKYSYIADDLKNNAHKKNVENLFKEAGVKLNPVDSRLGLNHESAKAFLIWLAISTFGISFESDLVLCYMGLLNGYATITGVQERRKKYVFDSHAHSYNIKDPSTISPELAAKLTKKAKNLNKDDKPLIEEMINYFDALKDKTAAYLEASERYLVLARNGQGIKRVKLPDPSFISSFDRPIFFNFRLKNPLFCGREDVLQGIERNLSSAYERKVVILYGMGGTGKTQIALEYAYLHQYQYSTVVWLDATSFVSLDKSCRDFLIEYTKYNEAIKLSEPDTTRTLFRKFINRRISSLIILDNADYIDCDDARVQSAQEKLMSYIPNGRVDVIMTTRNDRMFYNCQRIRVDVFGSELSTEYLNKKTGLKADSDAEILAKRLGFLPLALDYAASYILANRITYKDYLELWDENGFTIFDQTEAKYTERTIKQTIDITFDKLKEYKNISFSLLTDLLRAIVNFSSDYLPLEEYIAYVSARDKYDRELIEERPEILNNSTPLIYMKSPLDTETDIMEGIIFVYVPKESRRIRFYAKYRTLRPMKIDIVEIMEDPMVTLLNNKIRLNEYLRILADYSLLSRYTNKIAIHPMLREVIISETPPMDRVIWEHEESSFDETAKIYKAAGDLELATKYKDKQFEAELNHERQSFFPL